MASQDDGSDRESAGCPQPYARPTLTLIGNMNNLLAGSGTQETDGQDCTPNSLTNDDSCN